jgi:lipopolysaccharide transport system permease protein
VDFLVSAAYLALVLIWYRFMPPANIIALPLFVVMAFAASLGAGLWIAALMVDYRDFRVIVPFVVQFGLYATPVGYLTKSLVPDQWRLLYSVNPMVGVIEGFRWSVLGGENDLYLPGLAFSVVGITLMLASGIWYFRKTEKSFADVI